MERVRGVLFAAGLDVPPEADLPERWRQGALEVHLDALLERCVPLAQLPADPRAVDTSGQPLLPTRALRLVLSHRGTELRAMPISAERGLPEAVALPVGCTLRAGERVDLLLHHPEQRAMKVGFEGVVGADGFVTPRVEPAGRGELEVLLSSLDVDAPAPRLVPPREPVPGLRRLGEGERPQPLSLKLGCVFSLGVLLTLPITAIAGALALLGVISGRAVLWASGLGFLGVAFAFVWLGLSERSRQEVD
jgi:hypothetical protein